jgi:hypothetical protein
MPTYLIKKEIHLARQEGDTAEITFVMPAIIDMSLFGVLFMVSDKLRERIICKSSADNQISIDGQTITIPLLKADTLEHPGKHNWEMQIFNANQSITTGKGQFVIIEKLIH